MKKYMNIMFVALLIACVITIFATIMFTKMNGYYKIIPIVCVIVSDVVWPLLLKRSLMIDYNEEIIKETYRISEQLSSYKLTQSDIDQIMKKIK